jgi:CRP/FNR family transcriptional regulator
MSNSQFSVSCQDCKLNEMCLPHSLQEDEIRFVDETVKRGKPLQRNQHIFHSGADFKSIYAVRSGAVKTYTIDEDGEEHVIGFHLPGEIFGLDAIDSQKHVSSSKALETSAICEIPYTQIEALSHQIQSLQSHMYRLLSREIRDDQVLHLLLGKRTAEERIGSFLLNLSMRHKQRNLSASNFRLAMSRTDVGNYLGLAVETVSRIFTRLQEQNVLKVDGKDVEILDQHKLCDVSHQPFC